MSSVDNRVVQMEFDNKRFESNVKTTMSTLDKLKQKLSFGKETKELEELQNAGNNFNMAHMASTIDKIGDKFSMLGVLGMTAMNKIASAAVDAGTRILKSLSVDQISAGFDKYTEETNSVQAIYSAVKPKGKTLSQVYDSLEKLAKYTDETSYNYTVMTGTLANFIGKGLDMQRSETMLEGIANAAASAGVGIQDANILFRNWADAVSSGALALKDWKSMKLVHMDTEAFVNELIDMAKEVGTVDKATGKLSKTMTSVGKAAADEVVTINNFEDLLRYGFVNTEVMARVFEKYADQTTEFGLDAFHAAQQARTFVDVIESLKDATSTGWKTSFRIIFGDLEEATSFFSDMADKLLGVVGDIDEARNNLFMGWRRLGGRDTLIEGLNYWWESFETVRSLVGSSFKEAFGIKDMPWFLKPGETYIGDRPEDVLNPGILLKWTEAFNQAGNAVSSWLDEATFWDGEMVGHAESIEKIFGGLFSVANIGFNMLTGVDTFFAGIRKQLAPTFDVLVFYLGKVGGWLSKVNQYITENNIFGKFADRLAKTFEPITRRLPSVLGWMNKMFTKVKQFVKLNPTMSKAIERYGNFFNAVIDFLPKGVEGLIQLGKSFYDLVINSAEWKKISAAYNLHVRPILKRLTEFSGLFAQSMADFLNMDTSKTKGWWNKLKQRFSVFDWLGPWMEEQWGKLKAKYPIFQQIEDWWNTSPIISALKEWVREIGDAIDRFFSVDTSGEDSLFGKLSIRLSAFWSELEPFVTGKIKEFIANHPFLQSLIDWWNNSGITDGIKDFIEIVKESLGKASAAFAEWDDESDADPNGEKAGGGFFSKLKNFFRIFWENFSPWLDEQYQKFLDAHPKIAQIISVISSVADLVGDMVNGIKAAFAVEPEEGESWFDTFKKRLSAFWAEVMPWFDEQKAKAEEAQPAAEGTANAFTRIADFVKNINPIGIIKSIGDVAGWVFGLLKKWFGQAYDFLKEIDWAGLFAKVKEFVSGLDLKDVTKILLAVKSIMTINKGLKAMKLLGNISSFFNQAKKFLKSKTDGGLGSIISGFGSTLQKLGIAIMAAGVGIRLVADAFVPLANLNRDQIINGSLALGAIVLALGILSGLQAVLPSMKIKSMLGLAVTALVIKSLLKTFAEVLEETKDISPEQMLALSGSMDLMVLALGGLVGVVELLNLIGVGGAFKGAVSLGILAAGLSSAIGIFLTITGKAIEDFSNSIAFVGANLAAYSDQVVQVNKSAIVSSIGLLKLISETLFAVGAKDYGNLTTFRTEMVRMGAGLKLFGLSTNGIDTENAKKVIKDLKEMSNDLSGFAAISEVPESIGLIGGAIKLYGESVNCVEIGDAPDSEQIKTVLTALLNSIPEDATVTALGEFANADKSASLTLMATGIVNIGTALSSFSADVKDMAFEDVGKALEVLTEISKLNTGLTTVKVANIGPFALEVKEQSGDLATFATDIVLLGDAAKSMATSMGEINLERFERATDVIVKIADMNTKLPPTGGLKQLLVGGQDLTRFSANLRLLGGGAVAFSEAIQGESFDASQVEAAGKALVALAEVNNLLPETGGFKSWFSGDESISTFASQLKTLGEGVVDFNGAIGETKFGDNVQTALKYLTDIANLQVAPSEGWTISIATLGRDLYDFAVELVKFNAKMNEITSPADLTYLESVLNLSISKHNELGNEKYIANLKAMGADIKDFTNQIKGIKASNFTDISTVLTDIFDALSKPNATDFENAGQSMVVAIAKGVTDNGSQLSNVAIVSVCNAAVSSADSYYNDFYNVGFNYSAGLADGMGDNSSAVSQAAASVVRKALDAAKAEAQQNSPWKTTQEMGKYFDYGLAEGMNTYRDVVEASSKDIVTDSLNPVLEQLKMVASLPFDELDLRPTIRPVLDTSDLTAGAQGIGRMFDDQRVRIRGLDTRAMESYAASLGNLDRKDSVPGIMQSINDINGRLDNLGQSIRGMRVVLNSGKVVGGIEDEMDKALGMRMIMSERGNS